ncbi:MAG: flavodoxin family protein, partial [Lentisphaerae bacterium]|nr:flavodoxin family protein [Lentisphaerota bacterium]
SFTVAAFSSSPRSRANSEILTDRLLAGAEKSGASVTKAGLHHLSIKACTACGACQSTAEAPCVIDDDMSDLIAQVRAADALVFASPIYFAAVNAQMKLFLDRLFAVFGGGDFLALEGKRMGVVLTYGADDPFESGAVNALRMFQDAAFFLKMDLRGWVHAACMDPGDVESNSSALDAAFALGEKLARDC